jgi:hypothetical protein
MGKNLFFETFSLNSKMDKFKMSISQIQNKLFKIKKKNIKII